MTFDIFPQNKYSQWYKNLVTSRQFQSKTKFKTESHHIFPVSIFGKNDITVNLTHREHFIAHLLLKKLYNNSKLKNEYYKMVHAINNMSFGSSRNNRELYKVNSILFETIKEEVCRAKSEQAKLQWQNPEFRESQTKVFQEYWSNQENRDEQSKRRKEHLSNPENYDKMCEANKKLSNTPEWKKQRSEKQKELSSNHEYTKKRLDAMSTPEAIEKMKSTMIKNNKLLTPEERKYRFSHPQNEEQRKANSEQAKGRKRLINKERNQLRNVKGETLDELLFEGWTYWNNLTKEEKTLYNSKYK